MKHYTDAKDGVQYGKVCTWKELLRSMISEMKKNQMLEDSMSLWSFPVISVTMKANVNEEN